MAGDRVRRTKADLGSLAAALWEDGRGWVLVVIALGWLLALGTRLVLPALLPAIKAEFAISNTVAGAAVSLVWLTYASMQFPAGIATDRRGERDVMLASLVVGTAGVLAFALAPLFALFLVACVLFGLGTGLYGTPRVTLLSRLYPERDGTALGLVFSAGSLGAAALPFLAGVLAVRFGWRAGFGMAIPLFLLALLGVWRVVPGGSTGAPSAMSRSPRHALGRLRTAVTHRSVTLVGGAITLLVFVYQGTTAFLPLYLVTVKGLPPETATALFGLFFATGAVVQPFAGAAADRYGDRPVMFLLTGAHVALLVALTLVQGVLAIVAVLVLLSTRAGLGPINNAYLVVALPADVRGSGYGLLRSVYMGIGSLGAVAVGVLADAGLFDQAFLALAALSAVALALYVPLPPRGESGRG